jgi:regulator of replication initiation timing
MVLHYLTHKLMGRSYVNLTVSPEVKLKGFTFAVKRILPQIEALKKEAIAMEQGLAQLKAQRKPKKDRKQKALEHYAHAHHLGVMKHLNALHDIHMRYSKLGKLYDTLIGALYEMNLAILTMIHREYKEIGQSIIEVRKTVPASDAIELAKANIIARLCGIQKEMKLAVNELWMASKSQLRGVLNAARIEEAVSIQGTMRKLGKIRHSCVEARAYMRSIAHSQNSLDYDTLIRLWAEEFHIIIQAAHHLKIITYRMKGDVHPRYAKKFGKMLERIASQSMRLHLDIGVSPVYVPHVEKKSSVK